MQIRTVAIIGAGTMGGGIAITAIAAGLRTILIDADPAALERASQRATKFLHRRHLEGLVLASEADAALSRLELADNPARARVADLVIEAVYEDLEVKRRLFASLAGALSPTAILATNTSCLRVADLAEAVDRPERFLGLHYFSPAEVNALVEVVSGPDTAAAAVEAVRGFLQRTGKRPLECRDSSGFAVNRFFCPYSNEAARCLDDGLGTPAQIDAVARAVFGLTHGPFAVMNIVRPRINLHAIRNLAVLGPFYAPATSMEALGAEDGRWDCAGDGTAPDTESAAIVRDRLLGAVFLPVLEALDEGVAEPEDFDLGARLALRFGHPPFALMEALGPAEVRRVVVALAERHGSGIPRSLDPQVRDRAARRSA